MRGEVQPGFLPFMGGFRGVFLDSVSICGEV
jgi:hypothetical protein